MGLVIEECLEFLEVFVNIFKVSSIVVYPVLCYCGY